MISGIVRIAGIFYRRRVWFLAPFIGSVILSAAMIVLLMRFYDSPILPDGIRQWLEAESRETLTHSIETVQTQLDQEKANIHQFEQINKNELMPRLRAHLRVLAQLHVDLHDVRRAIDAREGVSKAERDKTERLVATWLNKRSTLADLQKKYSSDHPKVMAFKKAMNPLEREIARSGQSLETGIAKNTPLQDLRRKEKALVEQVRLYESRVERVPEQEKALAGLVTKYERTRQDHQTLLQQKPTYIPDSVQMGLRGILLGFGIGLILVIVREKMDRALHTDFELEHLLSLPVLATVFDYKDVPSEGVAQPSATWLSGSGDTLYGRKTVFISKDRP